MEESKLSTTDLFLLSPFFVEILNPDQATSQGLKLIRGAPKSDLFGSDKGGPVSPPAFDFLISNS
jgi:hypothetical protein